MSPEPDGQSNNTSHRTIHEVSYSDGTVVAYRAIFESGIYFTGLDFGYCRNPKASPIADPESFAWQPFKLGQDKLTIGKKIYPVSPETLAVIGFEVTKILRLSEQSR